MKILSKIVIPAIFLLFSCIDDFIVSLPVDEPHLVVDALISSVPGESKIRLGWTSPIGEACLENNGNYSIPCQPDTSGGPYLVTGMVVITRESNDPYAVEIHMTERKRFIDITPNIIGTPGERFSLDIEITYNNQTTHYHSETVMLQTPVIDSMSYVIRTGDIGKSDDFVPLIYFKEPQDQKNYYLFRLCQSSKRRPNLPCGANNRVWSYSLMRDDFLPAFVSGLSIDDGATVAKYADFYPEVYSDTGVQVRMYSVTRETYEFYKALLDQFNNDGGAYSPTPATPPGNIRGGAIGLFRAVHESTGSVYL
jgi:hypothetical protein